MTTIYHSLDSYGENGAESIGSVWRDPAYQRSARTKRAPHRLHELGADGGGEGFEGRGVHGVNAEMLKI